MSTVLSSARHWIAPDLQAVIDTLTDLQIVPLTLFGEARAEPIEGIVAVGCVIRNRVNADLHGDGKPDWWGEGYREVSLAPVPVFDVASLSKQRWRGQQLRPR